MKILSVSQIREADAFTIAHEPIASIDLMERAARACYYWFHERISRHQKIAIICGMGNNGGDGLALARMLSSAGYKISVYIIAHSAKQSPDFKENKARLEARKLTLNTVTDAIAVKEIVADVYVDALLGSGLSAPLNGLLLEVVNALNAKNGIKVAIDIPTGLFADQNTENTVHGIFSADHTLTFQTPKRSFFFAEFGPFAGEIHVLPIGLSPKYIDAQHTHEYYVTADLIREILPKRNKFDHKGTYGHALLIVGSKGKIGAGILASKAALRSGAGRVTAYVPQCGLLPLQIAAPEVMAKVDAGAEYLEDIAPDMQPQAIGMGPGIGTAKATQEAVKKFLLNCEQPVVLDADAINCLSIGGDWHLLPKNSILTPHLGELDRMLKHTYRGESVYAPTRNFAKKHQVYVLLKGAHSALYAPNGNVYFNSTGTNALATAGSGDVLTGVITGLCAQGMHPKDAALAAMYFHGMAGASAAKLFGERAVIASDILNALSIMT